MLKFEYQGSARRPYTVTADGQGDTLRMFCTCQAGKHGQFCKHVAAALVGDVTNLVGPSDGIEHLARMSVGSALIDRAQSHRPSDEPDQWVQVQTVDDVVAEFGSQLKALGFDYEISRDAGDLPNRLPCDQLRLFAYFKNGRRRTTPSHVLSYEPLTGDLGMETVGPQLKYENIRNRQRPWGYGGATRSILPKIIPDFLRGVGLQ
jgi:hypothetical protein